ncbi:ATP-binding cassette domain-containing protein [Actinospica sp. MGRD01-02]|uniref:ATP-binding cassette domain-containing protein n=1 Tax=Actinospica acidithermotolerans TaxID=2828514 RepID=A0A941EHK5_9ACTN|nr:ATP-binding cassette domain-containing protein [Actinospica acidithermotolerans]MBR7827779.1 ATP-binding cassette domain-containing protein [Actinospica acidithermotolerans]
MDTMTPTEPAPSTANATTLLLTVDGLAKSFGPTKALRSCSLELRGGEVHALMGENGSGKSTLVKILAGVHRPDAGRIELAGSVVSPRGPREAIASGVATVFQEVQCVAQQSVLDNLWLGTDGVLRRARGAGLGPEERRARAGRVLTDLLGTCPDLDAPAGSLSLSERQAVAIARSLLREPEVLILDEATSALDVATRDRLFAACRALTARGGAVLFISHRMDEVEQIAERVTVLRSGESVGTLEKHEADIATLVHLMTGGEALVQSAAAERPEPGAVVLEGHGLNLRAGEIIGLAGLEGQGQDHYLRSLSKLADAGTRVGYVARDRREESIFPPLSIRENFTASTLGQDARAGLISTSRARARFDAYRERLKIRLGRDGDAITTLSGGNQQKVVIARALAGDPQVLLLNDPTRGIDIGAKHDVYALLRDLAASGMAIVMLSTEVDEHLELMDRVLVFREGEPAAELDRASLSRSALVTEFFGPAGAQTPEAEAQARPAADRGAVVRFLAEHTWVVPAVLTVGLLIANVVVQHSFLAWHSWILTFAELATPGLAAMASTPAILGGGGGIDISIAPLFVMVSVVIEVMLLGNSITSAAVIIPVAVLVGAAVGALNGVLINYGRYQAVVATLCMNFILSGLALGYAPSPASGTSGWLTSLGSTVAGIPGGLILLAIPLIAWALLARTPFVRTLCAVGGSEITAYTAGVNVPLIRTLGYTLGGAIAGLAGIAITAQLHQAEADTGFVTPFILMAIAAVALGGTSLGGGRGGLLGSLLGAAVIFLIENLLGALHISSFWSQAVYGATLIAAVLFAARTATLGKKAAR